MLQGSPHLSLHYFLAGARLIAQPGYRRYVLIPLLANVVLFVALTLFMINLLGEVMGDISSWLPSWLTWLAWLVWPLMGFVFLVGYGYSFNLITNIIAAPFFGFLVEKIQADQTGIAPREESLSEMIPRTLLREATKLWYFISRGALVLLVMLALIFVPGVNMLAALLWAVWGVWCMAVQYMDYPADANRVSFRDMRRTLNKAPLSSYSYGAIILGGSMIPILNIVVAPIAVAGAALYWIGEVGVGETELENSHPSRANAIDTQPPKRLPPPDQKS